MLTCFFLPYKNDNNKGAPKRNRRAPPGFLAVEQPLSPDRRRRHGYITNYFYQFLFLAAGSGFTQLRYNEGTVCLVISRE
jgi:hypothetical protein